jgi:hypothetical protein
MLRVDDGTGGGLVTWARRSSVPVLGALLLTALGCPDRQPAPKAIQDSSPVNVPAPVPVPGLSFGHGHVHGKAALPQD